MSRRSTSRGAAAVLAGAMLVLLVPQPANAGPTSIRDRQWYLEAMQVDKAHEHARGEGVIVAVVDTGVDSGHRDLRGQVLEGTTIGGSVSGQIDEDGHGTGMASLVAAKGGAADRQLGVAPRAKILPVRIAQRANGSFRADQVYRGVQWAIDHGARVVNISLGGPRMPEASWKQDLISYAMDHDVVLVAAAGNRDSGDADVAEPAAIPGVIAVSGLNRKNRFWPGSAKGGEVVVAAPAEQLVHAAPRTLSSSGYAISDGTSGATALVTGVVTLIRSRYPKMSAADVVNRLIRTARDLGPDGRDEQFGFGAVNALAALTADVPHVDQHPLTSGESASPAPPAAAEDRRNLGLALGIGGGLGLVGLVLVVIVIVAVRRPSRPVPAGPTYPMFPVPQVPWPQPPPAAPPSSMYPPRPEGATRPLPQPPPWTWYAGRPPAGYRNDN